MNIKLYIFVIFTCFLNAFINASEAPGTRAITIFDKFNASLEKLLKENQTEYIIFETRSYWSVQFTNAINNGKYQTAISILSKLPHHPIARDCLALLNKNMSPNNIFYSKTNLDSAFLGPINRENLWYLAYGITKHGQKPHRSPEAHAYFKEAERRLLFE